MALFNHVKGESDKQYIPAKLITPGVRIPDWAYYPYLFLKLVGYLIYFTVLALVWAVKFAWLTVPLAVFGYLGFAYQTWILASTVGATVGVLGLWWWKARPSFWKHIGWFYIAQFNRHLVYRREWRGICTNLRLATAFEGDKYYPRIIKVRRDAEGDIVTVRMLGGQHPSDWIRHASRFAYAYNALSCTIKTRPGRLRRSRITIHLRTRDALARVFRPFPVPAAPDINRLQVALRSSGAKVAVSLRTHLLIAGASDAGKGSVLWAIVSALAAGVRDGLVRIIAFDPKGGVEFADGEPLFHQFHYGSVGSMADALEDVVKELKRRQAAKKGKGRDHTPTTADPSLVLLIDEFGALTGYVGDRKLKDRINAAMSLILSQGRAVGIHVVAALQDPRKEVVNFRGLFHSRIALRLNEESDVALILDDDADRGAACHEIPEDMPGVGYMILPGVAQPERVRFPYHTDADIKALAATYGITVDGAVSGSGSVVPQQVPATSNGWVVNR